MNLQDKSVLVVEDEFIIAEILCAYVEDMGVAVCGRAAKADEAVALVIEHRPAVILMDVRLIGEKDGIDAALAIRDVVDARVIFITGSREPATISRIDLVNPYAVLFKPAGEKQLKSTISAALGD